MEKKKTTEETEPELTSWMEGTVHRCLLYLGDFTRYQLKLGLELAAQPARYFLLTDLDQIY